MTGSGIALSAFPMYSTSCLFSPWFVESRGYSGRALSARTTQAELFLAVLLTVHQAISLRGIATGLKPVV